MPDFVGKVADRCSRVGDLTYGLDGDHGIARAVMLALRCAGSLTCTAHHYREASVPRDEGLIWSV